LVNTDPHQALDVGIALPGLGGKQVSGRILTAATMQAHNTFEAPDAVAPAVFTSFKADGDKLRVDLPAKAVVTLEIPQGGAKEVKNSR